MAWKNRQKYLVHLYAKCAGLCDQDYREILYQCTGARTAADRGMTQYGFERTMAHLEAVLDYRVSEGFVARPPAKVIHDLQYWRTRLASKAGEACRHLHVLDALWEELREHLPESQRGREYLLGIASKAVGYEVQDLARLGGRQAGVVITALRDRLRYALRHG